MASAAEALGMTLPGSSSFPAESEEKIDECRSVGAAMRNLIEKNILPRDIMTKVAFENAMASKTLSSCVALVFLTHFCRPW
jgi:dihydroxy-acid dehydratase